LDAEREADEWERTLYGEPEDDDIQPCPQCAAATYTICKVGKVMLFQVKRAWRRYLLTDSAKTTDLALTILEAHARAFRTHTGHSWTIYP
jgi:hypothetical protein